MSSGTLPLSTYHRAQAVGEGTYGSVLVVYNDDGEEFALKLFIEDEDEDEEYEEEEDNPTCDLGALREISILRLLREQNGHENIVQMADVKPIVCGEGEEEDYGTGTSGCIGMAMPLYRSGTLGDAIDKGLLTDRQAKVTIAHGLLSAVAFLHDNGIIHRDIKADNVMLEEVTAPDGATLWKPVLIDFSLAKTVNSNMYGIISNSLEEVGETHTGEVGTVTYQAPEIVAFEPYGLSSDLWSVGVLLLEMIRNHTLPAFKNKQAGKLIEEAKQELPDQPFANLVRGLLTVDSKARFTARQALSAPLFEKFGMSIPHVKLIKISDAVPLDNEDAENEENCQGNNVVKRRGNKKTKDPVLRKTQRIIQRLCNELGCTHPMTRDAALTYSQQMYQLDDKVGDISASQTLLDCVVLASKFFETKVTDLTMLDGEEKGSFRDWNLETYADNEATIWMLLDHCLYPRVLAEWDD